jgi:hypothetical protein
LVLLVLLLAGATWWVYRAASIVVKPRVEGAPAPAAPRP